MKYCFLDAEFNGTSEHKLNIVSIAAQCYDGAVETYKRTFWLYEAQDYRTKEAREFFRGLIHHGHVFVSYVMEAEVRALLSLFGDDTSWLKGFKAIDLYLEYRCLLNHCDALAYGRQYRDGRVITTVKPKPKWQRRHEEVDIDEEAHHKPSYSMGAAVYKLLEQQIDSEQKNEMRDIIIRGDREEIIKNAQEILAYNEADIKYLPRLLLAIKVRHFRKQTLEGWEKAALSRGDYATRTARMIQAGYPVNVARINAFTSNVPGILKAAAEDCNSAEADFYPFRPEKKTGRYVLTEKAVRHFIVERMINLNLRSWRKTDKGALSISRDAFRDHFDPRTPGFAGAYCRYVGTKQILNGFMPAAPGSKRSKFKDFLGSDGRVRPYFGIYGAQSSRSQPGATGFIPLKAHWMRVFIEAPKGYGICGIDYASQEFLIAAILSQDSAMMAAYASGDVYLAFAKTSGLAPPEATKASHGHVRNLCKVLVLAMQFDMSAAGMAPRIQAASGVATTEERAQELIDLFYKSYPDFLEWKEGVQFEYHKMKELSLPDGWIMWGDNDNFRSVGNFPIQGHGAVIMREAVRRAQDYGLKVIFTLHDAIYIEYRSDDMAAVETLKRAMAEAFESVMAVDTDGSPRTIIPIRLEGDAWSTDYRDKTPEKGVANVVFMGEYSDEKSVSEIERFRPFFNT